jgi:hypothetical protein
MTALFRKSKKREKNVRSESWDCHCRVTPGVGTRECHLGFVMEETGWQENNNIEGARSLRVPPADRDNFGLDHLPSSSVLHPSPSPPPTDDYDSPPAPLRPSTPTHHKQTTNSEDYFWLASNNFKMAPAPPVETVTLNTGAAMPLIGLGTAHLYRETGRKALRDALAAGYRHIDCAKGAKTKQALQNICQNIAKTLPLLVRSR